MHARFTLLAASLALPATSSLAQTFSILSPLSNALPAQANAVSANGRFATGMTTDNDTFLQPACVWNASGLMTPLAIYGDSIPIYQGWSVANDGLTVAGESNGSAIIWSPAGDSLIGDGAALGLTPDASTSVGYLYKSGGHIGAFRRSSSGTTNPLPPLPGDSDASAQGITPDGAFVVGYSADYNQPVSTAVVWHNGVPTPLDPAFIYYLAVGSDISDDGTVVVGSAGSLDGVSVAVRWVNGVSDITMLNDFGNAWSCSADGNIVVGETTGGAFVWDLTHGARLISDILDAAGVDLTGLTLSSARSISSDGDVIVGLGFDQNSGNPFAWRATLSTPCPADFNNDHAVDFFDYDQFVQCFEGASCPPGATADFDNDGTVDFFDYDAFVVAFETPC